MPVVPSTCAPRVDLSTWRTPISSRPYEMPYCSGPSVIFEAANFRCVLYAPNGSGKHELHVRILARPFHEFGKSAEPVRAELPYQIGLTNPLLGVVDNNLLVLA